jgi:hypothetical protein
MEKPPEPGPNNARTRKELRYYNLPSDWMKAILDDEVLSSEEQINAVQSRRLAYWSDPADTYRYLLTREDEMLPYSPEDTTMLRPVTVYRLRVYPAHEKGKAAQDFTGYYHNTLSHRYRKCDSSWQYVNPSPKGMQTDIEQQEMLRHLQTAPVTPSGPSMQDRNAAVAPLMEWLRENLSDENSIRKEMGLPTPPSLREKIRRWFTKSFRLNGHTDQSDA